MNHNRALVSLKHGGDFDTIAAGRSRKPFPGGAEFTDAPGDPTTVHLLSRGEATLAAETPFGPWPVATITPPALLNLFRAVAGSPDLVRLRLVPGSETVPLTADEARGLLFSPDAKGQAFRRLALASVASAIRETNAALARFFDELPPSARTAKKKDSGEFAPVGKAVDVDPGRLYDLFDAAGLNPSGPPDLGLLARSIPPGGQLVKAGTAGDEAYLLAEGKLRVSLRIPGVGEEALAIVGPGEIVGEMALIDDALRSADVVAHDGSALVYVLSRRVFRELLLTGDPAGAPLLAGITIALTRRHEEGIRKAAAFRAISGPF
jgi:hypothetical protein